MVPATPTSNAAKKSSPARCMAHKVKYPPIMAKAECARLTTRITPNVTVRPTEMRNSNIP